LQANDSPLTSARKHGNQNQGPLGFTFSKKQANPNENLRKKKSTMTTNTQSRHEMLYNIHEIKQQRLQNRKV